MRLVYVSMLLALVGCWRDNPLFDSDGGDSTGTSEGVQTSDDSLTTDMTASLSSGDECGTCAPDERCVDGACSPACGTGLRLCADECVDVRSDGAHCGDCDRPCDAPTVCGAGECRSECPAGTQQCGASCPPVDHVLHCGGCDQPCDATFECREGACVCPQGTAECEGACVDKATDPQNCGDCGLVCESGECAAAECVCEIGQACDGICRDTANDPLHCNACNSPCEATQVCSAAQCVCAPFYESCNDICVNTFADPDFCGGCTTQCEGQEFCVNGVCTSLCDDGFQECENLCVDVQFDPSHCGECGNECEVGEACIDGDCRPYHIPPCDTCPCDECDAFCCILPTAVTQPICTNAASLSCV